MGPGYRVLGLLLKVPDSKARLAQNPEQENDEALISKTVH